MQPVLGLVEDHRLWAINDLVLDLPTPIGGQAVHINGVGIGQGYVLGCGLPVLVAIEDFLRQLRVVLTHRGLEDLNRRPGFGVENVGSLCRLLKIVDDLEGGAVHLGVFLAGGNDLGV